MTLKAHLLLLLGHLSLPVSVVLMRIERVILNCRECERLPRYVEGSLGVSILLFIFGIWGKLWVSICPFLQYDEGHHRLSVTLKLVWYLIHKVSRD